jgi:hypothetical protein
MLFRIRKGKPGLPYCAAVFTVKTRYIYNQFDLAAADRKHLEGSRLVAVSDDSARSAVGALQRVRMDISKEERLVKKTTFLYCTPDTPNV